MTVEKLFDWFWVCLIIAVIVGSALSAVKWRAADAERVYWERRGKTATTEELFCGFRPKE